MKGILAEVINSILYREFEITGADLIESTERSNLVRVTGVATFSDVVEVQRVFTLNGFIITNCELHEGDVFEMEILKEVQNELQTGGELTDS